MPNTKTDLISAALGATADQAQGAKAAVKRKTKPAASTHAPAGSGKGAGRQQQNAGTAVLGKPRQPAAAVAEPSAATVPIVGGTKQVPITDAVLGGRSGRPQREEAYPFALLTEARREGGVIKGPSFFIPDSDQAVTRLAAARKRHKANGVIFWSKRTTEAVEPGKKPETGMRIWRGNAALDQVRRRT